MFDDCIRLIEITFEYKFNDDNILKQIVTELLIGTDSTNGYYYNCGKYVDELMRLRSFRRDMMHYDGEKLHSMHPSFNVGMLRTMKKETPVDLLSAFCKNEYISRLMSLDSRTVYYSILGGMFEDSNGNMDVIFDALYELQYLNTYVDRVCPSRCEKTFDTTKLLDLYLGDKTLYESYSQLDYKEMYSCRVYTEDYSVDVTGFDSSMEGALRAGRYKLVCNLFKEGRLTALYKKECGNKTGAAVYNSLSSKGLVPRLDFKYDCYDDKLDKGIVDPWDGHVCFTTLFDMKFRAYGRSKKQSRAELIEEIADALLHGISRRRNGIYEPTLEDDYLPF